MTEETGAGWAVPGYRHVHELGSGASGRVVYAVHEESGRPVALKYLAPRLLSDIRFVERFRAEARLLAGLADEHLVRFFDYVESPSGAAIVMEFVEGVSLRSIMDGEGQLAPEAALVLLKGSLLGLAKAHSAGVVHRDYKPENVLVPRDGTSKLADFGIAVPVGQAGTLAGTPAYMAPEQWATGTMSAATDVYAATVVFFECLAGAKPYQATTLDEWATAHRSAPVPTHGVPEPVRGLVDHGMAKDPGQRPESAAAFVEELETAARRAYGRNWEKRGRRLLAALAAGILALIPRGLADQTPTGRPPVHKLRPNKPGKTGLFTKPALVIPTVGLVTVVVVGAFVVRPWDRADDEAKLPPGATPTASEQGTADPTSTDDVIIDRMKERGTANFTSALLACCQNQSWASGRLEATDGSSSVQLTRVFRGDEASSVPRSRAERVGVGADKLMPDPFDENRVLFFTGEGGKTRALGKRAVVVGNTAYARLSDGSWQSYTPQGAEYSGQDPDSPADLQRSTAEQAFDHRAAASPEHLEALIEAGGSPSKSGRTTVYAGTISASEVTDDRRFREVYGTYGSADGEVTYRLTLDADGLPKNLRLRWAMPEGTEAYPHTELLVKYSGWGTGDPIGPPTGSQPRESAATSPAPTAATQRP